MKATKTSKKETKATKKAETTKAVSVSTLLKDASKLTKELVATGSKFGEFKTASNGKKIRLYAHGRPLISISRLASDTPKVVLKPQLRGGKFEQVTGLVAKAAKQFKPLPGYPAVFVYKGEPAKLVSRIAIALKHLERAARA